MDSLELAVAGQLPSQDPRSESGYPRPQVPEVLPSSPPVIDLTGPTPSRHEMPPQKQKPKGCSLMSMEPLQQWFCKGADIVMYSSVMLRDLVSMVLCARGSSGKRERQTE